MNQAENLIKIYETGFQICLVLAILFLAVTAVLFWRFRILHMIRNRTGRAQRKAIEQMKEANEKTGRLRNTSQIELEDYTPVSLNSSPPQERARDTDVLKTEPAWAKQKKPYTGNFKVTREVMLVHTQEWI